MLVERVTAQTLADRQVAAVVLAAGGKGVEMPDLDANLAHLDAALADEPRQINGDERLLRDALGLSRAG